MIGRGARALSESIVSPQQVLQYYTRIQDGWYPRRITNPYETVLFFLLSPYSKGLPNESAPLSSRQDRSSGDRLFPFFLLHSTLLLIGEQSVIMWSEWRFQIKKDSFPFCGLQKDEDKIPNLAVHNDLLYGLQCIEQFRGQNWGRRLAQTLQLTRQGVDRQAWSSQYTLLIQ